ncbi:M48 family metallopeptidase [Roseovarius sp. EL26]|uniref:M48 family metallopeptidase n=1 Tax=Roseovarius sp. EL26 TaxID=2126672 RepID=UPI000EA0BD18|nr:M48 family metallopeptidase [Roseovarius sp. EL26]
MRWIVLVSMIGLTGCGATVQTQQPRPTPQQAAKAPKATKPNRAQQQQFVQIVKSVEPVAERECRARTRGANCDYKIVVDDRPNQPPNAFQTVDKTGRPILAFNLALIAQVRNKDELAFVMGHEAAHHIRGHLGRQQQNAAAGAIVGAGIAAILGVNASGIDAATNAGASVGARSYSKNYELEADALGTIITHKAGYNPVRGAQFFSQLPDPGNQFLGTHPPNAQRMETVRRVASQL